MKVFLPEFPNSKKQPFEKKSKPTIDYNCIAWACELDNVRYWPNSHPVNIWPPGIPNSVHLASFVALFQSLNYSPCKDGSLEKGYLKVAIFVDANYKPTHAARQLPNGEWTSKLGRGIDCNHTIGAMENGQYGKVAVYLKRLLPSAPNAGKVDTGVNQNIN